MSPTRPKVIHIVESLDRGAVENWLVRMMTHAQVLGQTLDWTFYCQLAEPGALDDRVRAMGGRIITSPFPLGRPAAFIAALRTELKRGDYEVMHCHHDLLSAVYMIASARLPIRRRLVHVHNADENLPTSNSIKASLLRWPMRRICLRADKVVGISNHTLDAMLAGRARTVGRDVVNYYGVDHTPFTQATGERAKFRRALDLADDALILLFGGRITPEKNPLFAIEVMAALAELEPRAVGIFAGAGPQEAEVRARASELGVAERVRMIGWRADLPEVMSNADWFILPRPEAPMEGFGLAVVEAQLAGLRMLLSLGVPDDPLLPTAVFRRLSISKPAEAWALAALEMLSEPPPSRAEALAALQCSAMDMDRAFDNLQALYQ